MIDGFFRVAFTGTAGSGFGLLVLLNGAAVGADVAGATFDGTYTLDQSTQEIDINVTMDMPAGLSPVQIGTPLPAPISVPLRLSISEEEVLREATKLVQTPLGPVNVVFKKLRGAP